MTSLESKIEDLDKAIYDLSALKAKLLAEQADIKAREHKQRLDRYKALEWHFMNTDYPHSKFRWSTAKKDTVKLDLVHYEEPGKYQGGLYETGPSFKVIVDLLQALDHASREKA